MIIKILCSCLYLLLACANYIQYLSLSMPCVYIRRTSMHAYNKIIYVLMFRDDFVRMYYQNNAYNTLQYASH